MNILLRLIVAHLLADFILQTNTIVREKKNGIRSGWFIVHILIVGFLTWLLLGMWTNWWAPLMMMAMHAAIDMLKTSFRTDNVRIFLFDQFLHLLSILLLWMLVTGLTFPEIGSSLAAIRLTDNVLVILAAYALVTVPAGILTGYLTAGWRKEITPANDDSLSNAGKWIGVIERILILTFILLSQWMPIGFLLAGKSIFRFGDLSRSGERKKTEYILIGTLLSFTVGIGVGLLALYLMHFTPGQ